MSLPAGQRRTLERIERALQASEPHLMSKFAIFTRLASGDGPIGRERIRAPRLRLRLRLRPRLPLSAGFRATTLISVAIGLLITGIVLGGTAHGSGGCSHSWHSALSATARVTAGCPGIPPAGHAPTPVQTKG